MMIGGEAHFGPLHPLSIRNPSIPPVPWKRSFAHTTSQAIEARRQMQGKRTQLRRQATTAHP
ncbi:MAG: hypothetical protein EA369_00425 [Bradymonadales bacterium]|nr:MAG: hypothetical protein EA369_00425 [Bradymonadales bacterium]